MTLNAAAPIAAPSQGASSPSVRDSAFPSSTAGVSQRRDRLSDQGDMAVMTDAAREEAIKRAGQAVVRHMAEWERTGCFAARGDADRARRLMELLIAGRSREYVAKLEKERGLA